MPRHSDIPSSTFQRQVWFRFPNSECNDLGYSEPVSGFTNYSPYVEYVAAAIDDSLTYTERVAESMVNNEAYNLYVSGSTDYSIDYSEYLDTTNNVDYAEYVAAAVEDGINIPPHQQDFFLGNRGGTVNIDTYDVVSQPAIGNATVPGTITYVPRRPFNPIKMMFNCVSGLVSSRSVSR